MKYLINSIVCFDTREYLLTAQHSEASPVRLSNTAGRVLDELIKLRGAGEPVTREHLFNCVWTEHSLLPSNGNLNQQVSLIRKAFVSLGLPASSVVTVPKRGLKLNDQLVISVSEESVPPPATEPVPVLPAPGVQRPPAVSFFHRFNGQLALTLLTALMTIITVSMAYIYWTDNNIQNIYFLQSVNDCNVYTLSPTSKEQIPEIIVHVKQAMIGNIDSCKSKYIVIFAKTTVPDANVLDSINIRTFMAKCRRESDGELSNCLNFYFYNWSA